MRSTVEYSAKGLEQEYQETSFVVDYTYKGLKEISGQVPVTVVILPKCKPFLYAQDLVLSTVVGEPVSINIPDNSTFVAPLPLRPMSTWKSWKWPPMNGLQNFRMATWMSWRRRLLIPWNEISWR